MRTRLVESGDRADWLRMRQALWPGLLDEHAREIDEFLLGRSKAIDQVFICEADDRSVIGFIELRIRHCAEGVKTPKCHMSRVGTSILEIVGAALEHCLLHRRSNGPRLSAIRS